MALQKLKGKVIHVGPVKHNEAGCFSGIKIEGFEGWLNFFEKEEKNIPHLKVGDMIECEYVNNGKYNVVKSSLVSPQTTKPLSGFKKSDEIKPIEHYVSENVLLLEKCFEALQETNTYKFFQNDISELQAILISLFIAVRKDTNREWTKN